MLLTVAVVNIEFENGMSIYINSTVTYDNINKSNIINIEINYISINNFEPLLFFEQKYISYENLNIEHIDLITRNSAFEDSNDSIYCVASNNYCLTQIISSIDNIKEFIVKYDIHNKKTINQTRFINTDLNHSGIEEYINRHEDNNKYYDCKDISLEYPEMLYSKPIKSATSVDY